MVEVPCPRCLSVPNIKVFLIFSLKQNFIKICFFKNVKVHQFPAAQIDAAALLGAASLSCVHRHVVRIADLSPSGVGKLNFIFLEKNACLFKKTYCKIGGRTKLELLQNDDLTVHANLGIVNKH